MVEKKVSESWRGCKNKERKSQQPARGDGRGKSPKTVLYKVKCGLILHVHTLIYCIGGICGVSLHPRSLKAILCK
jgi:hypothetical protein